MANCTHHWIIEPPSGPTSKGKCKRCRRVRQFNNAYGKDWGSKESHQSLLAQTRYQPKNEQYVDWRTR